jgi:hypothetical protein
MKSILQLFSVCILLLFTGEIIFSQTGSDYYLPLRVDNRLTLHTEPAPSWSERVTIFLIEGTDIIDGRECFREIGTEIDDLTSEIDTFHIVWLRKDSVGNVIIAAVSVNGTSDPDSAMSVNFNYFPNEFLTAGYSRTIIFGDIQKDSVISVSETVVTPAGTFNNCIVILESVYDDQLNLKHSDYHYYTYGIGMVKNERTFPDSDWHIDRLISYNVTGLNEEVTNQNSDNFLLAQNYPNPFNPSTKIVYSLPQSGLVNIKVFDVLGNEVAELVNENKNSGSYFVTFDGSPFSSGVYFCTLTCGNFSKSTKMLLHK